MTRILFAAALVFAATSFAHADPLEPGEKAPEINGVNVLSGKEVGGKELQGEKATVVLFTCTHCPIAMAYEDRFEAFTKKYGEKGVKLIAVDCSDDGVAKMKARATEKEYSFPYIADETQQSAKDFGATRTPELFVVDGAGVVKYRGAFDSDLRNPKTNFVAEAVDAILAGKEPETKTTEAFGCGITFKRK